MGVAVGPVDEERAADFLTAMGQAFGFDTSQDLQERFSKYFEWDRARAAYDGDRIVGTLGAFSLDLTVPGGTLPCGGTTVVSVLPTHRRRGILRQLMDAHFEDVRAREEPLAGLWASESSIYGRFGYGLAAVELDVEVSRAHVDFHRLAAMPAPSRLVSREEARELLPPFYEQERTKRPGFFARSPNWWEFRRFHDAESDRGGATAYRYAVTEENGDVTGFVQYRFKEKWDEGHGRGTVIVHELLGSTPESWAGLWSLVLNHDLTESIEANNRSIDDPLFGLLGAPRRARTTVDDSLWIKILDVEKALEGREYAANVSAVVRLHDPTDATTSTWRLDLAPDGASISATSDEPQVEMDMEDLAACFMGLSRFVALGAAGRVGGEFHTLRALDAAFNWAPQPWCPEVF